MSAVKVAHLTSVHLWGDPRIFRKMCRSLSAAGYDVHLIAARGPMPDTDGVDGVHVHLVRESHSRLERVTRTAWQLFRKAIAVDADIYHFHDPELILVGLMLRLRGHVVIYDVHEDMPKRVMDRTWIPRILRPMASLLVGGMQKLAGLALSAVVTATPSIAQRFDPKKTVVVRNYPSLDEFPDVAGDWSRRTPMIVYIGTIDESRGVLELINGFRQLAAGTQAKLVIAGRRQGGDYDSALDRAIAGLAVEFPGYLNQEQIRRLLGEATVGAITQLPREFANEAISTKMFEYMAAGIPVVSTDMPLWKQVIESADSGTSVNPFDCDEVAKALEYYLSNKAEAERIGGNGRAAIQDRYNWEHEFAALDDLYRRLLHD